MNTVDEKKAKEFMDAMVSFINGQVAEMKVSIRDEQQIRIAKLGLIQSHIKWLESLEATEKGDMPTALKAGSDASRKCWQCFNNCKGVRHGNNCSAPHFRGGDPDRVPDR